MGLFDFFKKKKEIIPENLKNIDLLLKEVKSKGNLPINLPKDALEGIKSVANTKEWYKQLDNETINTLNNIYQKWQNKLIAKEKTKSQKVQKVGESGGFETPKEENYMYNGVSYIVDEETGEFYLSENETIADRIFDELSLNENYAKVDIQFLNNIKLKWAKIRDENINYIKNKEFNKVNIIQFDSIEAYEFYNNYYYLLGLFNALYPFRTNEQCLNMLSIISLILYANQDTIKEKVRVYEYLEQKAYHPEKSTKELLEITNSNFNKINFDYIEENQRKVQFLKNQKYQNKDN